jgi:hypothetical protein
MVRHGTQNKGLSSHSSFNSDSRFMNGLNLTAAEDGQTQVAGQRSCQWLQTCVQEVGGSWYLSLRDSPIHRAQFNPVVCRDKLRRNLLPLQYADTL